MGVFPIVCILFILFSAAWAKEPQDTEDILLTVQTLSRHADRSPQSDDPITNIAPLIFHRGQGELTDEGHTHARLIGESVRQRYVTPCNGKRFIDGRYHPAEIQISSSDVDRVLSTAGAASQGLFEVDLEKISPAIRMVPYESDRQLAIDYSCSDGWQDVIDRYNLSSSGNIPAELLTAMRQSQWPCGDQPPANRSDAILSEFANSVLREHLTAEEKECAVGPAKFFMYDFIELLGGSGSSLNLVRLQRSVGDLCDTIATHMEDYARCYDDSSCDITTYKKMRMMYTHDVNVVATLNVFSSNQGARPFFQNKSIEFGTTVIFEMWKRQDAEPYVRMYVKNGVYEPYKEFDFCQYAPNDLKKVDEFCTLSTTRQVINAFIGVVPYSCEKGSTTTTTTAATTTTSTTSPSTTTSTTSPSTTTSTTSPSTTTSTTEESCGWGEWTDWSRCWGVCGFCGGQTRTRECNNGPDNCPCDGGQASVTQECIFFAPRPCISETPCCAPARLNYCDIYANCICWIDGLPLPLPMLS